MGPLIRAFEPITAGSRIYELMDEVFGFCRSITGQGVRDTFSVMSNIVPGLEVREVPSGESAFDWMVPLEWNVREAFIEDPSGRRIVDFADSPLHVVSYSTPIERSMSLEELSEHLHSSPTQPDAVPYRTSYYTPNWGFCLSETTRRSMVPGDYRVVMGTTLEPGVLNYGEAFYPGRSEDEILITAHICHPAQANDNLSGVAIASRVAATVAKADTKYSYRFLWIPGGIGSLVWLSRNQENAHRIAHGMTLACLGDEAGFTYKSTFGGEASIDLAARAILGDHGSYAGFEPYGFDERNFTSPAFRLDVGSLTRSPHGGYPEYHTSLDNMSLMSRERLADSTRTILEIFDRLETGTRYLSSNPQGEPQLGKRGLYGSLGGLKERPETEMAMLWLLTMSDGHYSDLDIGQRSGLSEKTIQTAAEALVDADLLNPVP